jgi:uncharacterized membrane protein YfcA
MEAIGFIAIFIMGIVLGVMGGGGSILTVPIMVYLFGLSPSVATGASLFVVGATALIGGAMFMRKGDVDIKIGLWFAVPSLVGVNISRGLVIPHLPAIIADFNGFVLTKDILVMATFSALMIAASFSMLREQKAHKRVTLASARQMLVIALQGLMVGLIVGFVGAGGGFLIIPALVLLADLSMRIAVGTSLMIIAFQSLLGFAGDVLRGATVEWSFLLSVGLTAGTGILIGTVVAGRIEEKKLKTGFGWFVLVMGSAILIEQLHRKRSISPV